MSSPPVRPLKTVAASRQRRGRRVEADILAQRRRLTDARNAHRHKLEQVARCEDEEHQLRTRLTQLTGAGFSISSILAMEHLQLDFAHKTLTAQRDADLALKQVEAQQLALNELLHQLARNRRQIEVVEAKIVELTRLAGLAVEDAEAEDIEETGVAGLAMATLQAEPD